MEYLGARGTLIHEKQTEVENLVSDSLSYTHPAPAPSPRSIHTKPETDRFRGSFCDELLAFAFFLSSSNSVLSLWSGKL
jgi:hypothetical protein